jgi:hypothetical protein
MPQPEHQSEILKTDKMGRVRTSLERREQLLDEFEKSKLSGQKFARLTGLKYSTFAVWVAARRRRRAAISPALPTAASQTVEWLETVIDKAQASTPVAGSPLIVRLPSGAAIELASASQASAAATLLRAWEKAPC